MRADRWPWRSASVVAAVALLAAACGGGGGPGAGSSTSGTVVFDSFGGNFQQQQTAAILDPFARASDVKVDQLRDGEQIYAKVRAQVRTKRGDISLFHADSSWVPRGAKDGILAPIDPSKIKNRDQLYPDVLQKYGVRILYWSYNITYSTKVFPHDHPRTWAEIWQYAESHPRKVALWGGRPNYIIEVALMADGVPPSQVYPLTAEKIDRAYRSLDKVKDNVIFYNDGTDGDRLFSTQVDIGMYYGGNVQLMIDKKVPLGLDYNQGIYTSDFWAIPKNAPNEEGAYALLNYALQPDVQAKFATVSRYGFVNAKAADSVKRQDLVRLASYAPNKEQMLLYDYVWWGENDNEQAARWNAWLRG